jgi:hypothetical protein
MDDSTPPRGNPTACSRTRLAENDVATVDVCHCGLLHLHMGPFSLRMTPTSLQILLATLAQATGATVTRAASARPAQLSAGYQRRGEA